MTREEFVKLHLAESIGGALPIVLVDGRMGLCCHWNNDEILVDAYRAIESKSEALRLSFACVEHVSGGLLREVR